MADPELSTKSPESDAHENTTSPVAQTGASMSEHCTTDRPAPDQIPKGEMTKFDDIDVYLAKPPGYPSAPGRLLLLLTGGTGVHSTNNQLQADKFAEHGYLVVMPDQFSGDPAPNSTPSLSSPDQQPTIIEKIKLGAAETAKSFMIDMWLARHTAEKVMPIVIKVLESAKDEFADAVSNGGGVYGVGYCFGAKYILALAGEHPAAAMHEQRQQHDEEQIMAKKEPLLKAGAIAHGTLITREDLLAIHAPICMVCVGQCFEDMNY